MKKHKYNYFKLGAFVVLIFLIFTYGIYRISDRKNLFGDTIELYVDFKDVKGLQAGNNVRFSGIKIGSVQEIAILNDTTLRVQMSVDAKAGNYLKKNAQANIGTDGLVGNMIVNISPGIGSAGLIKTGDILQPKQTVEMAEMLETLALTNTTVERTAEQLLEITQKVNNGSGSLALLLNSDTMAQALYQSTRQLNSITTHLNNGARYLDLLMQSSLEGSDGNLAYLLHDTSLATQIASIGSGIDSLVQLQARPAMDQLNEASESIAAASAELAQLLETSNSDQNVLNTLLADSTAASNLQDILRNLNEGTYKFDENMKALQQNWFFRRYFKKKARIDRKP